jgi:hypothetical protein
MHKYMHLAFGIAQYLKRGTRIQTIRPLVTSADRVNVNACTRGSCTDLIAEWRLSDAELRHALREPIISNLVVPRDVNL